MPNTDLGLAKTILAENDHSNPSGDEKVHPKDRGGNRIGIDTDKQEKNEAESNGAESVEEITARIKRKAQERLEATHFSIAASFLAEADYAGFVNQMLNFKDEEEFKYKKMKEMVSKEIDSMLTRDIIGKIGASPTEESLLLPKYKDFLKKISFAMSTEKYDGLKNLFQEIEKTRKKTEEAAEKEGREHNIENVLDQQVQQKDVQKVLETFFKASQLYTVGQIDDAQKNHINEKIYEYLTRTAGIKDRDIVRDIIIDARKGKFDKIPVEQKQQAA